MHNIRKFTIFIFIISLSLVACGGSSVQEIGNTDELRSSTESTFTDNSSSTEGTVDILPDPVNSPLSTDFKNSDQEIGEPSIQSTIISSIDTYQYANFIRLEFQIDNTEIPLVKASYSPTSKQITINIYNVAQDDSGIKLETSREVYNSVVSQIFHSVVTESDVSKYLIGIKKDTNFFLHSTNKNSKHYIVLDIKEVEGAGDIQAPGISNSFVTTTQSINPNVDGNIINIEGYSYSNQGEVFRIIWNTKGNGDDNIPMVDVVENANSGVFEIKVKISNIQNDYIARNNLNVNLSDSNAKRLSAILSDNISIYTITVSKLSEFKIYSSLAPSQVILEIKH